MKTNKIKDITNAAKKQAREEEIALHGKLISFRTRISKSKKVYDRKKDKDIRRKDT